MYRPPTCAHCGGRDFKPIFLSSSLKCTNCGCFTENRQITVYINPIEPDRPPRADSNDDWVWLILAMLTAVTLLVLSL